MLAAILVILLAPQEQPSGPWLLHREALRGETTAVEMMLKLGAGVDSPDKHRRTALHDACLKGHADTARVLLDHGAKIGARDDTGATPLHDAALGGDVKTIELLLDRKADVETRDSEGHTPLDYAQRMDRSDATRLLQNASKQSRH